MHIKGMVLSGDRFQDGFRLCCAGLLGMIDGSVVESSAYVDAGLELLRGFPEDVINAQAANTATPSLAFLKDVLYERRRLLEQKQ